MLIADRKGRWTSYRLNHNYEILPEQYQMSDMQQPEIEFRNDTDRIIYEYVCVNGFITSAQVLQITRINTNQGASVALNRLISQNLLKMVRNGKTFIYELNK